MSARTKLGRINSGYMDGPTYTTIGVELNFDQR